MEADHRNTPADLGVRIRRMYLDDVPAGLHLCRLSRWNQTDEDWRAFLDSPDGGGWLAEGNGTALGTVTFLRYGECFSWLSMMLVHPQFRRLGIGARLMGAATQALGSETCIRLDATPLGEPLYRRFGFKAECGLVRLKVRAASGGLGPAPETVRPMEAGDLADVFRLDRQAFDADRSALLSSFYRRAPDLAFAAYRGGALLGFCFGRNGHFCRQLGPVVAQHAEIARDLVVRCIGDNRDEEFTLDAPQTAPEWTAWLESVGFLVERPFLRMCRGQAPSPGLTIRQFAVAGPEFG